MLNSPMLDGGSLLQRASSVLVSIIGGPDLTIFEADRIMSLVSGKIPVSARKLTGVVLDENWRNRVSVVTMLSEETGAPASGNEEEVEEEVTTRQTAVPEKTSSRLVGMQANLDLIGLMEKGRFKNMEPTYWGENNLDVPTFIRKKITIKAD